MASDVWGYTPRQIKAWLQIAERRRRHQAAHDINVHSMAARGAPEKVEQRVKALTRD